MPDLKCDVGDCANPGFTLLRYGRYGKPLRENTFCRACCDMLWKKWCRGAVAVGLMHWEHLPFAQVDE